MNDGKTVLLHFGFVFADFFWDVEPLSSGNAVSSHILMNKEGRTVYFIETL